MTPTRADTDAERNTRACIGCGDVLVMMRARVDCTNNDAPTTAPTAVQIVLRHVRVLILSQVLSYRIEQASGSGSSTEVEFRSHVVFEALSNFEI